MLEINYDINIEISSEEQSNKKKEEVWLSMKPLAYGWMGNL